MTELRDRLEVAVAEARRLGADDVEVSYAGTTGEFVRFAGSRFTQVGETAQDLVRVRVLRGRRLGSAMGASLRGEEMREVAAQAVEMAGGAPELEVQLGFADGERELEQATGDRRQATGDRRREAGTDPEVLRKAFDGERDVEMYGALKRRTRRLAVMTGGGLWREHDDVAVQLDAIGQVGDGSGWAGGYGEEVEIKGVVRRAADVARRARGAMTVEPGAYDVVLAPAAIAELVEWMAMASFGARSVIDGTSLLCGRVGELVCSPRVTVSEACPAGELPFDCEGMARRPVDFLRDGRAGLSATDLVCAARLADGRGSTGHAAPLTAQLEPTGPAPAHVRLEPGAESEEELVAKVERGLYVTRLHYVNGLLDTRRATMTGMTRNGTFLIENGVIGRAVGNLRFTDSLLDALGEERLGGIGRDTVMVPTWWSPAGVIETPAVLLRRFQFSGTSRQSGVTP